MCKKEMKNKKKLKFLHKLYKYINKRISDKKKTK